MYNPLLVHLLPLPAQASQPVHREGPPCSKMCYFCSYRDCYSFQIPSHECQHWVLSSESATEDTLCLWTEGSRGPGRLLAKLPELVSTHSVPEPGSWEPGYPLPQPLFLSFTQDRAEHLCCGDREGNWVIAPCWPGSDLRTHPQGPSLQPCSRPTLSLPFLSGSAPAECPTPSLPPLPGTPSSFPQRPPSGLFLHG